MTTLHRFLLLSGVAAVLTPGLAQAQLPAYELPYTLNLSHPASYVTGDAQAVVLGQLTEDAIPDACVLHGTQAHLLRSVDRRNRWRALSGSYTGITLLPQAQSNGRDGVLAVDGGGLVKLLWNGSSGVETLVAQSVSGTSSWAGATHLQVVETPAGDFEAVGLASDGLSILRWSYEPSTGAMANLGSLALDNAATALTAIDWTDDGEIEYACAGAWGCRVTNAASEDLLYEDVSCNRSMLLRVQDDGQEEKLVWVFAPSGTEDVMTVLSPSAAPETPIYLAGASLDHMLLQDLGDDARKELVLFADGLDFALALRRDTSKTFQDVDVYQFFIDMNHEHTRVAAVGNYSFPAGSGVVDATLKAPVPAVYDLDGDGDEDLFAAGHPGGAARAMIYLCRLYDEESVGGTDSVVRPWIASYVFTTDSTSNGAHLDFEIPGKPSTGPAADATHVRLTFWTQAANASYMDLASAQVLEYALPLAGMPQVPTAWFNNVSALGNGWIHIEVSYLKFSGATMVKSYPAYHEQLALQWFTPATPVTFRDGESGTWGLPPQQGNDGTAGGTSGRPPSTPPSGGGG